MSGKFYKDPDDELDYQIDWTEWLDEDVINSSSWIVPDGVTEGIGEKTSSYTSNTTTIWLSEGELDVRYEITNRITTVAGRETDRSFVIVIKGR